MTDILERLRAIQNTYSQYVGGSDIMRDAADEIDRLRSAMDRFMADYNAVIGERNDLRARLAEIKGQVKPVAVKCLKSSGSIRWLSADIADGTQLYAAPMPAIPEGWQFHGPLKALTWACKNNTGAEPSLSMYQRALEQAEYVLAAPQSEGEVK